MTTRGGRTGPRGSARRGTAKRSAEQDATLWGYIHPAAMSMQNRWPDDAADEFAAR